MSTQPIINLNLDPYIFKFGICEGTVVVRGLSFAKLLDMSVEDIKLLFQPHTARQIRQLALETLVNGRHDEYRKNLINDVMDLCSVSMEISCMQHKNIFLARTIWRKQAQAIRLRSTLSERFLDTLEDMYLNNEIRISITHPVQFSKLFNLTKDSTLTEVLTSLNKHFNLLVSIDHVSLSARDTAGVGFLINTIVPSVIRSIGYSVNPGRRIRGLRELVKHIRDIKGDNGVNYQPHEETMLLEFLNRALIEGKRIDAEKCTS